MIIRRNVYFSAIDEQTGEEKLFSTTEISGEEREFSEKKKKKDGLKTGDKVGIWTAKHLQTKKDREAMIEAYDGPNGKGHKLAKQSAKYGGAIGAGLGAIAGSANGVKGAAAGAAALGAGTAAASYVGTRLGVAANKVLRKHSRGIDDQSQRTADRNKVAAGKMTKEEYAKKHNKK